MGRPFVGAFALVVLLGGCFGPGVGSAPVTDPSSASGALPTFRFGEPVQINIQPQEGFEPSLRIGPDGVVYVAAARGFLAGESGSVSSPVWFSKDDGQTWNPLATMLGIRERMKTIEGDLAIDAKGTVYFVDTYAADNVITVWGPDQSWRATRPIQGTLALDDRPWLAAHGDGVLYYVGNSIAPLPGPGAPPANSRIWFYRSTDAGLTWTQGYAFRGADYCHVAANPADDTTVTVLCSPNGLGTIGAPTGVTAYVSRDRGTTWSSTSLGPMVDAEGDAVNFPAIAFSPEGNAFAFWVDEGVEATLHLHYWDGETWTKVAAPYAGVRAANPWVAAGPNGTVGLAYYGQNATGWHLHLWRGDGSDWVPWVDPDPVSRAAQPPEDFFQIAFDRSSRLHVAFQRDPDGSERNLTPYLQPVYHALQAT